MQDILILMGKVIYYIEDSTIKNPYNPKKALEMLQSSENVTVVHTLDDLKE